MSDDLIRREDAIKAVEERSFAVRDSYTVKAILRNVPSANRPKGEWVSIIEVNDFGEPYQAGIYCSECGETFGHETNFCPYCGADMRESRERRE